MTNQSNKPILLVITVLGIIAVLSLVLGTVLLVFSSKANEGLIVALYSGPVTTSVGAIAGILAQAHSNQGNSGTLADPIKTETVVTNTSKNPIPTDPQISLDDNKGS